MVFSTSGPDLPIFAVDLAYSSYAAPVHNALREDAIVIVVARDGEVFLRRRAIHAEDLPGAIEAAVASGSERAVYLSIDERARYGDVKPVIDEIRSAGISDVVILMNRAGQARYIPPQR
jgi:biopolymer transport protein ExbD